MSPSVPLPEFIGKYRVEALLGRGGMGEVYRATDPTLDRTVAIKTIRADAEDPGFVERFRREGRAAGRLKHPHIVTVFELGEAEGRLFMAMEYVEGQSLSALMRQAPPPFGTKLAILVQMCEALDYAHAQGVVHRDIKPANVQVLPDGSIKLLDFGVARILTAESVSQTGSVVGTPFYMAPEQLRGQKVDRRADIYSAGVLAYELLAERRPFEGNSITEVIYKVITEPARPMETPWTRALPQVEKIVFRAIEKDPDARYSTAGEMAADLRAFLAANGDAIARVQADVDRSTGGAAVAGTSLLSEGRIERAVMAADAAEGRKAAAPPPVRPATSDDLPTALEGRARKGWRTGRLAFWAGAGAVAALLILAVTTAAVVGRARAPKPSASVTPVTLAPVTSPTVAASPEASPSSDVVSTPGGSGPLCVAPAGEATARAVAGAVREALRARGVAVADDCASSGAVLRIEANVSLRPSPFAGTSARTADYVGSMEAARRGAPPRRFDFSGHAMEFGDNVARSRAISQLASRMAERAERWAGESARP